MKTILCIVLILAGISQVAVRAADDKVRAAVITQTTDAPLRLTQTTRQATRQSLEAGHVYEVVSNTGAQPELKLDADRVVRVSPQFIKVRECTKAEFDAAAAKFNTLNTDAERKTVQAACQQKLAAAQKQSCATCPIQRAQAAKTAQQARQTRDSGLKALAQKQQALLTDALAWAATK